VALIANRLLTENMNVVDILLRFKYNCDFDTPHNLLNIIDCLGKYWSNYILVINNRVSPSYSGNADGAKEFVKMYNISDTVSTTYRFGNKIIINLK
jgi:hypothetical protein